MKIYSFHFVKVEFFFLQGKLKRYFYKREIFAVRKIFTDMHGKFFITHEQFDNSMFSTSFAMNGAGRNRENSGKYTLRVSGLSEVTLQQVRGRLEPYRVGKRNRLKSKFI